MKKNAKVFQGQAANADFVRTLISSKIASALSESRLTTGEHPPIIVFVMGASGFGKTRFAESLLDGVLTLGLPDRAISKDRVKLINGDNFGSRSHDGKWIVDIEAATRSIKAGDVVVFEVSSDNMDQVKEGLRQKGIVVPVMPIPPHSVFVGAMRAKARDYAGSGDGQSDSWLRDWKRKAGMSRAQYSDYVISKIRLFKSAWPDLVVVPTADLGEVLHGWHRTSFVIRTA